MPSAFEQYFTSIRDKNIAVLGLGVSNRPLVRLLLEFGCTVTGCDRTPREKLDAEVLELEAAGCHLSLGETYLDGISADLVFRTPGRRYLLSLPCEARTFLTRFLSSPPAAVQPGRGNIVLQPCRKVKSPCKFF